MITLKEFDFMLIDSVGNIIAKPNCCKSWINPSITIYSLKGDLWTTSELNGNEK